MTPVAPLTALAAVSWDAALEETLSGAVDPALPGVPARVHSVHRRVLNVRFGDELIALVGAELDDAPATVRVPVSDWRDLGVRQDSPVRLSPTAIRLTTGDDDIRISLDGAACWHPGSADLSGLTGDDLAAAHALLASLPSPTVVTDFGRAAQDLLSTRTEALRAALVSGHGVTAAAGRLIGLGEGLTPSGDDILTGVALVAAQHGAELGIRLPALSRAILDGATSTGLLSAVTMRHAARGRARQSLHVLLSAIATRDRAGMRDAAARILEIGHTSGADILTGIRLALDAERSLRTCSPAPEGR